MAMDQTCLISVIVPVWNIEKYLPKCLDSLYHQTYQNLEIILVDDGSTDRSGVICDEYALKDSRCKVIHQPNMDLWAARNSGQNASHGEFLLFPDGDDYLHHDMIRLLHQAITSGNGYDVSVVGFKRTDSLDESVSQPVNPVWEELSREKAFDILLSSREFPHRFIWNKLYRRSSIGDLQSRPFKRSQDYDFTLRCFMRVNRIICTRESLYYYVIREDARSTAPNVSFVYFKYRAEINYRNYVDLPPQNPYKYAILAHLYKEMRSWRVLSLDTENEEVARQKCMDICSKTIKDYIRNPIPPFWEKVSKILRIYFPGMCKAICRRNGQSN